MNERKITSAGDGKESVMTPTIADVAREAGVTKGTVSHVYSGHRPISTQTKARVHAAAEKLGWVPNSNARALAGHRTNAIGLVLHRDPSALVVDTFFPNFISGMQSVLAEQQIMLIMQVVGDRAAEEQAYRSMAHGRADGVVLLDMHLRDWRIGFLQKLKLPAVLMDMPQDQLGFTTVRLNSAQPMEQLIDYLQERGHTRIAHVSGPLTYVHAYERAKAYVHRVGGSALLREGDFTAGNGRHLTAQLLSMPDRPTAIIYSNNVMAIAGQAYAQEHGLVVPDDLALAGFEDNEICAHLNPPLTSIDTDPIGRGRLVAKQLIRTIAGIPTESVASRDATIKFRESTAGQAPSVVREVH